MTFHALHVKALMCKTPRIKKYSYNSTKRKKEGSKKGKKENREKGRPKIKSFTCEIFLIEFIH